jgi:hypothetical protein
MVEFLISVGGVVAMLILLPLAYGRWMDRVSRAWPVAEAILDSGKISPVKKTRHMFALRYSYIVAGQVYGGSYYKYFVNENDAAHLWTSLQAKLPLVRYDPRSPGRSYFDPYRDVQVMVPRRES